MEVSGGNLVFILPSLQLNSQAMHRNLGEPSAQNEATRDTKRHGSAMLLA